ncbi:MAG: iron-sulfur cluster repair di-iron protein [Acidobacteria bacterium]|nr:iron-sulfur cluster repair di-iron protein [Acidobacteriota bacterium]
MQIDVTRTVADYAVTFPPAKRVFEKLGIDYCCHGKKPIAEACEMKGVTLTELSDLLAAEEAKPQNGEAVELDFANMSLSALSDHIVRCHHNFTREEMDRIAALLNRVCTVHGGNHPELFEVNRVFSELKSEMEVHMQREERMLFPYISLMESSFNFGMPRPPAPFGTTRNPIAVMVSDHDRAAEMLQEIRDLTNNLEIPPDACFKYKTVFAAIEGLEKDLHQHIHLENNILFPKAIEMEDSGSVSDARALQEQACGVHEHGHEFSHSHEQSHVHSHGHAQIQSCGCGCEH